MPVMLPRMTIFYAFSQAVTYLCCNYETLLLADKEYNTHMHMDIYIYAHNIFLSLNMCVYPLFQFHLAVWFGKHSR